MTKEDIYNINYSIIKSEEGLMYDFELDDLFDKIEKEYQHSIEEINDNDIYNELKTWLEENFNFTDDTIKINLI